MQGPPERQQDRELPALGVAQYLGAPESPGPSSQSNTPSLGLPVVTVRPTQHDEAPLPLTWGLGVAENITEFASLLGGQKYIFMALSEVLARAQDRRPGPRAVEGTSSELQ